MSGDEGLEATVSYYARLGRVYDRIARSAVVRPYRQRLVTAVDLEEGETVVDVGTGTGANLEYLRGAVGVTGAVVGVDVTPRLLAIAGRHRGSTHLVRGDARTLPVSDVDAIVGSFVAGMVADPDAMVEEWTEALAPGGRLALLDAAPRRSRGGVVDELARVGFRLGATPGTASRFGRPPETVLAERVGRAHEAIHAVADARTTEYLRGFVRITDGRI
ncbi:MAG: class I SAM-dependent methyltransferase [Halanaeroarchaeum sp.]